MLVVMEYVHGEALSRLIARTRELGQRIPTPVACAIARDVLAGLHAAHAAGIVHRDVTPENVLIAAAEGMAKLTDFGVAKAEGRLQVTRDGGVKGKLLYLAPEQIGGEVTPRTDVYAVGLVLWEMLALERPLDAPNEAAILTRALDPDIAPPSTVDGTEHVTSQVDAVVMKALEKEPDRRYASGNDFANALAQAGPLASRAEIAAWIERLVGDRLAERALLVSRAIPNDPTKKRPRSSPVTVSGPLIMLGVAVVL